MVDNTNDANRPERIAKVMARAGLCSRREAERWIEAGRVAVDGEILVSPAVTVTSANQIEVDGAPLPTSEPTRLWRFHKPTGLLTTQQDPEGRRTVFEALPDSMPRVISVGRLDINSEGLLLLTNDGELARRLELPSTGWVRRYRVRVHGRPQEENFAQLQKGTSVEGVRYAPIVASLENQTGANAWLTMTLKEGKNREIRRVCEHFGWRVNRLIRVSYGPFQLGNLKRGLVEEVPKRVLADQIGEASGGGTKDKWAKKRPRKSGKSKKANARRRRKV
ncbi:MAG TPA: pseudouridine synthase [Rhodospirillaceae bacterium]|nr:pseudouridine synthase [Rhodospirillaceae bacterium]HAA92698.1 pseudouridine synthase [Rhodospirillaceae bacterium]HAT36118.1 pseudouridine synthase [Rhodospirillaceae bacterium]